MTLRQVYYQLVAKQIITNNKASYERLGEALVEGRKQRLFSGAVRSRTGHAGPQQYETIFQRRRLRRCGQQSVPHERVVHATALFEIWLEKDALCGIFEDDTQEYGVTLNVGRGFDGWSSVANAAVRADQCRQAGDTALFR